jgi:hypothetical protein
MYLHKTEDVNTKKVKQLKIQYVYLAIDKRAIQAKCRKCKSFGRIAFASIFEKCNISFEPQGYISFAPKNKIVHLRHFPSNIYVNVD